MSNLLYLQVVDALESEIKSSDMPVGTVLPSERSLAAKYHVSRNVIRQALQHLAGQNMIQLRPGRSAIITYYCDEKIIAALRQMLLKHQASFLDALEVREVLELAIIQKSIPFITDEKLRKIEVIWDEMEQLKREKKIEQFLKHDVLFHEEIARLIPNPMFLLLLQTTFSMSPQNFFDLSRTLDTAMGDTQREHRMILDGLKKRDYEQAGFALRVHTNNIRFDLSTLGSFHDVPPGALLEPEAAPYPGKAPPP